MGDEELDDFLPDDEEAEGLGELEDGELEDEESDIWEDEE